MINFIDYLLPYYETAKNLVLAHKWCIAGGIVLFILGAIAF